MHSRSDNSRSIRAPRGVEITAEVADLTGYVPEPGGYDLVVIAYLQLPADQLDPILRRAAAAVAPGGTFLLIGHDLSNLDGGYGGPQMPEVLTTPDQVRAALDAGFTVDRSEVVERHVDTDDGERVALDTYVTARRAARVGAGVETAVG